MDKMELSVEEVGPKAAHAYLETNQTNRRVRRHVVVRYAAEMASGNWNGNTAETIKFNKSGELIDGQHRLRAVILAAETDGCPETVQLAFARGVSDDAQNYVDTGLSRSAADVLALYGIANSNTVASIARLAIIYEECGMEGIGNPTWSPSNSRVLEFSKENMDVQSSACFADSPLMRGLMPKRLGGFLHYTTSGLDPKQGGQFMDKLRDGVELSLEDPELRLRNLFISNKARRRGKIPVKIMLAYSAKAWNARVEGRNVKQFKLGTAEPWPVFVDVQ